MKKNEKQFAVVANDSKHLFIEILQMWNGISPSVNIWGSIPKKQSKKLSIFLESTGIISKIRKLIFKEHLLKINSNNYNSFFSICETIDFNSLSWGVFKGNEIIALCRSDEDIIFSSNSYISEEKLESFIGQLYRNSIIRDFEM